MRGNKSIGTILIRADASPQVGAGHIMRCLALAQSWRDGGGYAIFAMARGTQVVGSRLEEENFEQHAIPADPGSAHDAVHTAELALSCQAEWIVLDGYAFDAGYQRSIKEAQAKVLVLDDLGGEGFSADLIVNQNFGAAETLYRNRESGTVLLLGSEYVLLRREFTRWKNWSRPFADAREVLVMLGGTDPGQLASRIIASGGIPGFRTTLISAGNVTDFGGGRANIGVHASLSDVSPVLARSPIAVVCGGGSLWECLFMQCATLSYAHNETQEHILQQLAEYGVVRYMGRADAFDPRVLVAVVQEVALDRSKITAGRRLVDGNGADRVAKAMSFLYAHAEN